MYATYPHRKNSLQSILENKKEKSLEFELKVELFHCEVEMSCLSNAPVQHSQPASVIKTDNDPNSATSLIFQLKPAAWFQPQTKRLVAGGEMEACHTVFLLFFFIIIIVLFFTFLSAPSDGFRSKASISLLLSFFSAMFWLHKSIYDDLSRRRKERRTFSPRKTDRVLAFRIMVTQLEGISEKQTGTRGGKVSSALLRRLRLSFIQPVLRSKKLKKC